MDSMQADPRESSGRIDPETDRRLAEMRKESEELNLKLDRWLEVRSLRRRAEIAKLRGKR